MSGGHVVTSDGYHVPAPLKDFDVWVVWSPDLGKTARAPWQNGHMYPAEWAESKDVDPRVSFDKATSVSSLSPEQIGERWAFPDETPETVKPAVLIPPASTDNDLLFVDFDDVRDPETKEVSAEVWDLVEELGGYTEVSSSGNGLHVWVRGKLPDGFGKFIEELDGPGQIEMYDRGRMTGGTWRHVEGTPKDVIPGGRTEVVASIVDRYKTRACPECGEVVRDRKLDDDNPVCPECGDPFDTSDPDIEPTANHTTAGDSWGREENAYYQLDTSGIADTGRFRTHRKDAKNPAPGEWQGPHPKHGATSSDKRDVESTNFSVNTDSEVWHCFAHGSGGGALSLIAVLEGFVRCGNADKVHRDRETLLKTCLAARDKYASDLEGQTPPYAALVAVAKWADLTFADPADDILGETAHRYAREIYKELSVSDL